MKLKIALIFTLVSSTALSLVAQDEASDFMRETGKIYVVVAVLATILIVLLLFLAYIDRRVRKLENSIRNEHHHNDKEE